MHSVRVDDCTANWANILLDLMLKSFGSGGSISTSNESLVMSKIHKKCKPGYNESVGKMA